jgi:hypothetical protein
VVVDCHINRAVSVGIITGLLPKAKEIIAPVLKNDGGCIDCWASMLASLAFCLAGFAHIGKLLKELP